MTISSVDFRESIANTVAVATEDIFLIDQTGKITTNLLFHRGEKLGFATGYVFKVKEMTGDFVEIYNSKKDAFFDVRIILLDFVPNPDSGNWENAQSELSKLLAVNAEVLDNLLAASGIAMAAERKGVDVSNYRNRIKQLYQSLANRNQELIDGNFLENKVSGSTALAEFSDDLNRVIQDKPAIGLAPIAVFIIKASVVIVFSVIAYSTLRMLLTGGKSDLSEAKKLVNEISKLDPEQAKVAKDILNKYYSSGLGNIVTYGLLAVGAFLGVKYLLPKIQK